MNEAFEQALSKQRRHVSRFICQELLYDYVEGRLDSGRKTAVEEYLPTCKDSQRELESLRRGLGYVSKLSQAAVSPGLIERVRHTRTGLAYWMDRLAWRNWPEAAQWSAEGILISVTVAAVVSILPFNKMSKWLPFQGKDVVLAEADRAKSLEVSEPAPPAPSPAAPAQAEPAVAKAESSAVTESKLEKKVPGRRALVDVPVEPKIEIVKVAPKAKSPSPAVQAPTQPVPPPSGPQPMAPAENGGVDPASASAAAAEHTAASAREESEEEVGASADKSRAKGPKGFVYRAFMASAAIDQTTGDVKALIESLGGEKAGQVDLGWHKANGTYFHFTLPESNYEQLQEKLRAFGPVRIYRDTHWRVMPEGQIRLILYIEDQTNKK